LRIAYRITLTPQARADVAGLRANRRPVVLKAIVTELTHQPVVPTRQRKRMRPNATATWELWVDPQRVFYMVDEAGRQVTVERVHTKTGDRLLDSAGREVTLDEPEA
jgi:mRNA-degrading endonuclease RelE of RelBE toxin-antitoxin system